MDFSTENKGTRHLDIAVDVGMLPGKAHFRNDQRPGVKIHPDVLGTISSGETVHAYVKPAFAPTVPDDLDGDGQPEKVRYNSDGTVDIWFAGSDRDTDPPDLTRVADVDPDVFDRGLDVFKYLNKKFKAVSV